LFYNFIPYLPPALPPSRQPFFIALVVPVGFLVLGRILYLLVFSRPDLRRKVVIVGAGWAGRTIHQTLLEYGSSVYDLVGYVDDDPNLLEKEIWVTGQDHPQPGRKKHYLPLLGGTDQLANIISEHDLDVVVIAITHGVNGELLKVFTDILQQRVDVVPMPVMYEKLMGRVPVEHIGVHWAVSIPLEHPSNKTVWKVSKRMFDLFWAGLGTLILLPIFPIVALIIYMDSPGPILYRQERLGRNGKLFKMYKFRSMITDAEAEGAVWAKENDPRITRFGKLLRKTHLDEFPQFFNILKGDMSVVGPRPERPEFVERLTAEIPFYRVRLAVKPGMAGWGLIHQGYGSSVEDSLRKLEYDLYYIKHQNLVMDFQILLRTFWETVTMRGF
jgi:exopolysaccharide biosynthesis polyprenyl glycosylphosphotransferase